MTTCLAAAAVAAATLAPATAQAEEVSPTGKGIAGGILLGAEVVMIPLGIAGVDTWWAYLLGGGLGAGAGAVGGYFVEQTGVAEPSLYMLAGGMALVIPTVVLTINATAYQPEVEDGEIEYVDEPGAGEPGAIPGVAEPPAVGPQPAPEMVVPQARLRRPYIPLSFVGVDFAGRHARLSPGIPAIDIRPAYTPDEIARYGVAQDTEVRLPVLSGRF